METYAWPESQQSSSSKPKVPARNLINFVRKSFDISFKQLLSSRGQDSDKTASCWLDMAMVMELRSLEPFEILTRGRNEPSRRFHNHREGPILGSSPGWNTRAVSFNTLLRHYAKHGLLRYCKAFAKVRWMQALVVTMTPHPLIVGYCSITPPPAWGATMRPQWRRSLPLPSRHNTTPLSGII